MISRMTAYLVDGRAEKELMEGMGAPLSTFSALEKMAYALGMLDEQKYRSIYAIRKTRNEFAHKITRSLTTPT